MKAVLHYRASPGFRASLADLASELEIIVIDEDSPDFDREIADAEVLLHVLKPVTRDMIASAPRLRLIQKIGVGVNTIDLDAAREHGVAVANMPGTNSQAVAELALGLMISVLRRIPALDALTKEAAQWAPEPALLDTMGEISGRAVGFLGFGEVPRRIAPAVATLGGRVLFHDPAAKDQTIGQAVDLDTLFAESDILSLHVPLTESTREIVNAGRLALMRPGAIIINTARGELIDEVALYEALASGRLRGAGLDVFAAEPVRPDNMLLTLPQVVATPHLAWLTPETLTRSMAVARENCRRIAAGEALLHRVA
ncbi:MAG: 2-hydroxyacid dehydrogenase [Sphingopyxis sp.]|uniref:NAD(P)-dependent oxidoreductase n=1 Tax=Sphingopyxis sp. TaxID=1908224 RepID=UPI001A4D8F93|nr:2-hydroxyacid dehydrogenase [Sphingopyxis sp.]MBL9069764.1 2-hydroxyacid dehydrogenase [Sphingopyxis sp.]